MSSKTIALLLSAILMGNLSATTWQVEKTGDDLIAAEDPTGATPFKTIQAAVDKAAAGETVIVGDGTYDMTDGITDDTNGRSLVKISRVITLKSRNGAAKTILKGCHDATDTGLGDNAVRCLDVKGVSTGDTVIQGFTLADGASKNASSGAEGRAGSVFANGVPANVYLIGCIITNCISYQYGVNNANFLGCHVIDCRVVSGTSAGEKGTAAFTLFERNGRIGSGNVYVSRGIKAVNCTWTMSDLKSDFYYSSSYATELYNCLVTSSVGGSGSGDYLTVADSILSDNGEYPLVAPLFGDARVRAGSAADGTGNPEHLAKISLPAGWTLADIKDPYGRAIDTTALNIGAAQESVSVAGGGLSVPANVEVNGVAYAQPTYVFPTEYPVQYKYEARLGENETLFGYQVTPVDFAEFRFPQPGRNYIYLTPSPDAAVVTTSAVQLAASVLWVAPGEAGVGSGTEKDPYGTINDAIDAASASQHTVIRAKAGAYSKGARLHSTRTDIGKTVADLWNKRIRLVSEEGAEKTFIVGAPDPSTEGTGENAVKCAIILASGPQYAQAIQGFTLTGGYSLAEGTGAAGAAVCGSGKQGTVTDCIISNNVGAAASALKAVVAERCVITGNTGATTVDDGSTVLSSVLYGNTATDGTFGEATVIGCSVRGTDNTTKQFKKNKLVKLYNTIVTDGETAWAANTYAGCLLWNFKTLEAGCSVTEQIDPYYVGATDLRVLANSAAFGVGEIPTASNYGVDWYQHVSTDFTGAPLVFNAGRPVVGAFNAGVAGVHVTAALGGLTVPEGVTAIEGAATLDVAGSGVASRPCAGIIVAGVTNFFADLPGGVYTVTSEEAKDGLEVEALYTSDWYLDPAGDDGNSGFTPQSAKRRFVAMSDKWVSGDTLHLAAGTYADADDVSTDADGHRARVVIPDDVTVCGASDGASVIAGAPDTAQTVEGANGCGPAAVRCVVLGGANARVRNCMLFNGHTDLVGDSSTYKNNNGNWGGGVFGVKNAGGWVENCVITNCVAVRGAASYWATLVKCLVIGNASTTVDGSGAAGMFYGNAYGTLFTRNTGSNWTVMYPSLLSSCTIVGNTVPSVGSYDLILNNASQSLVNTLCDGPSGASAAGLITHCAFANDKRYVISADMTDGTCIFTEAANLAVDDSGRPVVGVNVAVDKADSDRYPDDILDAADLTGFQRIMNAALDIGALEGDWREIYRRAAGVKNGTCEVATAGVTTNDAGRVVLASGDAVEFKIKLRVGGKLAVAAGLENGTLAVALNGVLVSEMTESGTVEINVGTETNVLKLSYVGEGAATIAIVEQPTAGLILLFR